MLILNKGKKWWQSISFLLKKKSASDSIKVFIQEANEKKFYVLLNLK